MKLATGILLGGFSTVAWATEPAVETDVHGDLKTFYVATFPYDNSLYQDVGVLPADPTSQATLDGRLKLSLKTDSIRFLLHHAVTTQTASIGQQTGQTGLGVQAPQLLDLGWTGFEESESEEAMTLQGRTDRLNVSGDVGSLTWTVGRQPITLGHGLGFTPMDLVNPFFPTTVDQEYKPGVDAVTADVFFGTSTKMSLITAYTDEQLIADTEDWNVNGMAYALYAQHTFGRHDLGILLGEVRGDEVVGLTLATYAGPVGIHSDLTYTLPADAETEDPFFRGVVGALWSATDKIIVTSEFYHQTVGVTDSKDYLTQLSEERYQRGELWLVGTTYGSASVSYQVTPLVQGTASFIGNLLDSSALFAPGVNVSISDEVQLVMGGFMGLGERPDELSLTDLIDPGTGFPLQGEALNSALGVNSEFGFYPSSAHLGLKAYF
ncbi:MAG: hypothetical protein ACPGTU_00400 [Myxococcota bacterium]